MIDMALFTGAYTNPLAVSPDTTIQAAMDATQLTLSSGGSPNVNNLAMTVVIITGSEGTFDHPWAGLRANDPLRGQPGQDRQHVRRLRHAIQRRHPGHRPGPDVVA